MKKVIILLSPFLFVALSIFLFQKQNKTETIPTTLKEVPVDTVVENIEPDIGSLIMIGHWADTPYEATADLIETYQVAGVIIMSAPENTAEIKTWIDAWQAVSETSLLIAIDQEGGPVTRLKGPHFIQTGQREITTKEQAYEVGLERGKELTALGINMDFAPVLDTANNPDSFMYGRVFPISSDTASLAVALASGLQAGGVIPVAKHFPGHDDTSDDSHLTLPTVATTREDIIDYTKTFADFITQYEPKAIMTAHVLFPNIDTVPATLSSYFLSDLLRNQLDFTGIIITDDMSMDAIDTNWSTEEASVLAIDAGADLILFAAEPNLATSTYEYINLEIQTNDNLKQKIISSNKRMQKVTPEI